jgi:ribbon-helix-helix CopG family protein
MSKKKAHGGRRKGAGRKLANPDEGRAIPVAAGVPSELVDRLDALAKERGWNRSQAITEAIRGLLDAKRR